MSTLCCYVAGCVTRQTDGIPLHRFPNPSTDIERFQKWLKNIGKIDEVLDNDYIYRNRRVCQKHFKDIYLYPNRRIGKTAVPSQKLNEEHHVNQPKRLDVPAGAGEVVEDDDNVENDIRFEITLDPDEINNEDNNPSVPTLFTNYTKCYTNSKDEIGDCDINASLGLKSAGTSQSELFSWNKNCDVVPEVGDDDDVLYEIVEDADDVTICGENQSQHQNADKLKGIKIEAVPDKSEHVGFSCNCCNNSIVGYRYSCVQCDDYDLCGRCEARAVHALHYMLRVPGPRPYEEVQSMLQLIRRQLFQSDIFLKSGDANEDILVPNESIKLEKEEIEEVDPFGSTSRPASVAPLFGRVHDLEDTSQGNAIETDTEYTTELPSDNVQSSITSKYIRRTYKPRKRKFRDSDVESTEKIPSFNVLSEHTHSDDPKYILEINNTRDIDGSDKEYKIDLRLAKASTTEQSTNIPLNTNLQDCNEEYTKDSTCESALSNPAAIVFKCYPYKRQTKQQRRENYDTKHNNHLDPKVVLSRLPLELDNKQNLARSDGLRVDNVANVASTVNAVSNKLRVDKVTNIASTSRLVTPEHLGLSKMDLKKMSDVNVQDQKKILIRIHRRKGQSTSTQPRKIILPQNR